MSDTITRRKEVERDDLGQIVALVEHGPPPDDTDLGRVAEAAAQGAAAGVALVARPAEPDPSIREAEQRVRAQGMQKLRASAEVEGYKLGYEAGYRRGMSDGIKEGTDAAIRGLRQARLEREGGASADDASS